MHATTNASEISRRNFLRSSLLAGLGAVGAPGLSRLGFAAEAGAGSPASRVTLTHGEDRVDNTFQALKPFAEEIRRAIGDKRVIVKPNNVSTQTPLCATHADCLEGILEFLKSIGKTEVTIAESAANAPTMEGFDNYGYVKLAGKYHAKLMDLDQEPVELLYACDETDFRPHGIRIAKPMLDPGNFIISAAKFKTHDRVVATLSLKNIVVGAPIKDPGFRWDNKRRPGAKNDKPLTHGNGFRGINYNLFALGARLHPHLAVIDGYQGMEGEGPVGGTPVEHRVAVASLDWLAADRVAVELMGIDFAKIGYLNFCAEAGMGEADLKKIAIVGDALEGHVKTYKLAKNIEQQLIWQNPIKRADAGGSGRAFMAGMQYGGCPGHAG